MKKLLFIAVVALLTDCVLWLVRAAWVAVVKELHPGVLMMAFAAALLLLLVGVRIGFRLSGRLRERWVLGRVSPAELFAGALFAFIFLGLFFARDSPGNTLDIQIHDTYFVIAERHVFYGIALLFDLAAGIYFIYPRILRRSLSKALGFVHFGVWVVGMGVFGFGALNGAPDTRLPGRYFDYSQWLDFNQPSSCSIVGVLLVLAAQVVFVFNLVYSALKPVERGSEVG